MAIRLTQAGDTITVLDSELGVVNGDKDTSYTIQLLTKPAYKEIEDRHKRRKPNPRTHQMEDIVDWEKVAEDLIDYVLQGWEGILDNTTPAPCTRDYKLRLDGLRQRAMLDLAGLSQIQQAGDVKASSFRGLEAVR